MKFYLFHGIMAGYAAIGGYWGGFGGGTDRVRKTIGGAKGKARIILTSGFCSFEAWKEMEVEICRVGSFNFNTNTDTDYRLGSHVVIISENGIGKGI